MEPLYNGQVGAEGFVRYSEVSFIGRFHHNNVYLTPYMVKDCLMMSYYIYKYTLTHAKHSYKYILGGELRSTRVNVF